MDIEFEKFKKNVNPKALNETDLAFFGIYGEDKDQILLDYCTQNEVDPLFYLKMAVSNQLEKSYHYLINCIKAIDYIDVKDILHLSNYKFTKKNEEFSTKVRETILLKKINLRAKIREKKKILKNMPKYFYLSSSNTSDILLYFKLDSDFKDVIKLYHDLNKRYSYLSDFFRFALKIRKFIPREIKETYEQNLMNITKEQLDYCFEGSISYTEQLSFDPFEKKFKTYIQKTMKASFSPYRDFLEVYHNKVDKGHSYNYIHHHYELATVIPYYDHDIKTKTHYAMNPIVNSLIEYFKHVPITIDSLIEYKILKKLNQLILFTKEKKQSYYKKQYKKLFVFLMYYKKDIPLYLSEKIFLLYKRLNSKEYNIPLCALNLSIRSSQDFIYCINKRFKIKLEDIIFSTKISYSKEFSDLEYTTKVVKEEVNKKKEFFYALAVIYFKKEQYVSGLCDQIDDVDYFTSLLDQNHKIKFLLEKYNYSWNECPQRYMHYLINYCSHKDLENLKFQLIQSEQTRLITACLNKLDHIFLYPYEKNIQFRKQKLNFDHSLFLIGSRAILNKSAFGQWIVTNETFKINKLIKKTMKPHIYDVKKMFAFFLVKDFKNIDYQTRVYANLYRNFHLLKYIDLDFNILKEYGMSEKRICLLIEKCKEEELMLKQLSEIMSYYKKIKKERFIKYNKQSSFDDIHTDLANIIYYLEYTAIPLKIPHEILFLHNWRTLDRKYKITISQSAEELLDFSLRMKNCIKSYISQINRKELYIFNILYKNKPYMNISIKDRKILEMKLKANRPVADSEQLFFQNIFRQANLIK